jgi:hypothetical protein
MEESSRAGDPRHLLIAIGTLRKSSVGVGVGVAVSGRGQPVAVDGSRSRSILSYNMHLQVSPLTSFLASPI